MKPRKYQGLITLEPQRASTEIDHVVTTEAEQKWRSSASVKRFIQAMINRLSFVDNKPVLLRTQSEDLLQWWKRGYPLCT